MLPMPRYPASILGAPSYSVSPTVSSSERLCHGCGYLRRAEDPPEGLLVNIPVSFLSAVAPQ
jgi:hypothetical protein